MLRHFSRTVCVLKFHSLPLSLFLAISVSVALFLFLFRSVSVSVSLSHSLSFSVSRLSPSSLCLSVFRSLSLWLCLSLVSLFSIFQRPISSNLYLSVCDEIPEFLNSLNSEFELICALASKHCQLCSSWSFLSCYCRLPDGWVRMVSIYLQVGTGCCIVATSCQARCCKT